MESPNIAKLLSISIPTLVTVILLIVKFEPFVGVGFSILISIVVLLASIAVISLFDLSKVETKLVKLETELEKSSKRLKILEDQSNFFISTAYEAVELYEDNKSENIEKIFSKFISLLDKAANKFSLSLLSEYKEILSPDRMHELLDKYQKGQLINLNEIQELKNLLEQEKAEKERIGDIAAAIVLGIILIAILYLLSEAIKTK